MLDEALLWNLHVGVVVHQLCVRVSPPGSLWRRWPTWSWSWWTSGRSCLRRLTSRRRSASPSLRRSGARSPEPAAPESDDRNRVRHDNVWVLQGRTWPHTWTPGYILEWRQTCKTDWWNEYCRALLWVWIFATQNFYFCFFTFFLTCYVLFIIFWVFLVWAGLKQTAST